LNGRFVTAASPIMKQRDNSFGLWHWGHGGR